MKKHDYRNQFFQTLREICKEHPTTTIGAHIARASEDYPDTEALTDKCFLELLQTYQTSINLDFYPDTRINEHFYDADESYGQEEF